MNPSTSETGADAAPAPSLSDAELIARLDCSRSELMEAAAALQKPLHTVQRVENIVRTVLPLLPYAVAAIAVLGVASSLRSGRRLRPVLLIATGLDVWRLWKTYQQTAALPSPGSASAHTIRQTDSAQTRATGYP